MKQEDVILNAISMESDNSVTYDASLIRDPDYIKRNITEKNGTKYSLRPCTIEFPTWYMDRNLGEYGEEISYYGIFIIVMDGKYSVSRIPTIVRSKPINITGKVYGGVEYTVLEFGKDDPIISDLNVVQETIKSYDFFKNFPTQAKIPWFITPDDLDLCMSNLVKYAASGVGANPITNELVVSLVTRDGKNPDNYYRQSGNKGPYKYVPLTDLFYSVDSTINKIGGSRLQEALVAALTKKSKASRATDLEKHLKV